MEIKKLKKIWFSLQLTQIPKEEIFTKYLFVLDF